MLQNDSIDDSLGHAEIRRDLEWVEIMQRDHGRARIRRGLDRHRVAEVDQVCAVLRSEHWKLSQVPEIPANRRSAHLCKMKMKAIVSVKWESPHKVALP
jgi:hypothetical protein